MTAALRHAVAIGESRGAATLLAALALAACSGAVPGEAGTMDPARTEVRRTFARAPAVVLDRALEVLVARGEMAVASASEWISTGRRALDQDGRVELTGTSINMAADSLRAHVVPDQRRLVGDTGGRYYLTVRILREGAASTTVAVTATLVATTPGPGPIGGRPVTSDGTLEGAFLDALEASLASGR